MLVVRYKDLITALFIVATATWIWAEPSQEVRVPTRQPSLATQGWTIPDLNLSESTARIVKSAQPQPVKVQPRPPKFDYPEPSSNTLSWSDFDSQEFELLVSVQAGSDLRTSAFDVTFHGPGGFDLARDGGNQAQFFVAFGANGEHSVSVGNAERIGKNRWRFEGSDFRANNADQPIEWARLNDSTSMIVTTVLRDQNQSRFSRGANIMVLESDPVQLSLR